MAAIPVVLELGTRRSFASAVDWPGWCRGGKSEDGALEALALAADRYRQVAALAGLSLPEGPGDAVPFEVVERVPGNATTEFGAPGVEAEVDRVPLSGEAAARMASLVGAAWSYLDAVAAKAPEELRKGPRGGGRNRDKILAHELDAAQMYVRKLGLRPADAVLGDPGSVAGFRAAVLEALGRPWSGEPAAEPPGEKSKPGGKAKPGGKPWPPRYAARRFAWHTLDHAWEIEDRSAV